MLYDFFFVPVRNFSLINERTRRKGGYGVMIDDVKKDSLRYDLDGTG